MNTKQSLSGRRLLTDRNSVIRLRSALASVLLLGSSLGWAGVLWCQLCNVFDDGCLLKGAPISSAWCGAKEATDLGHHLWCQSWDREKSYCLLGGTPQGYTYNFPTVGRQFGFTCNRGGDCY